MLCSASPFIMLIYYTMSLNVTIQRIDKRIAVRVIR